MKPAGPVYIDPNAETSGKIWKGKLHFFKPVTKDILVIGHRGASGLYPENTMTSFEAAFGLGADMVELDVQLSKDGIPVVSHDPAVDRCTDGKGDIHSYTFSQLQSFDAGSWFSKRFRNEHIPSLEEVLAYSRNKMAVNIEIKSVRNIPVGSVVESTLAIVSNSGMGAHILFSSFDKTVLKEIRKRQPQSLIGFLYEKDPQTKEDPIDSMRHLSADTFNVGKRDMKKGLRKSIADLNYPFLVYTVNRVSEMKKWIAYGAGGLFTNRPDRLRKVVDEMASTRG